MWPASAATPAATTRWSRTSMMMQHGSAVPCNMCSCWVNHLLLAGAGGPPQQVQQPGPGDRGLPLQPGRSKGGLNRQPWDSSTPAAYWPAICMEEAAATEGECKQTEIGTV
jgi:hypothetical protein